MMVESGTKFEFKHLSVFEVVILAVGTDLKKRRVPMAAALLGEE